MIKIKNLKDIRSYIHPILLSIYPVIFLYAENPGEIDFTEILRPLVYLLAFGLYLLGATIFFVRDTIKSSLLVSLFLIVFYSWGYVYKGLESTGIEELTHANFMVVTGVIYVILALLILGTKKQLANLSTVMNVVAFCLVVFSVFNMASNELGKSGSAPLINDNIKAYANINAANEPDKKRDIYYLIFDQYAREDTLKEEYDFDNSVFINFLKERGFYIAHDSYSNYPHTKQSLSSSLNLRYINYLSNYNDDNSRDPRPLHSLIQDFYVGRFLKKNGYRYIHFGSGFVVTRTNELADENYNIFSVQSNERIILHIIYQKSLLKAFLQVFDLHRGVTDDLLKDDRIIKRERVLYQFEKLREIPDMEFPTFTFVHMLIPHVPYVFEADGKSVSFIQERRRSKRDNYINQLQFTNKKIVDLIDIILTKSEVKPIIIIQADEGPYPKGYHYRDPELSKHSVKDLKHKFGILNAYYLPGVETSVLYPSISPVNSFRVIFNLYFGTNYELLPDKHFNTNYLHYYRFIDVTAKLQQN